MPVVTHSTAHSTFIIERMLRGKPAHAFRFWSEPELRARWLSCHPDWRIVEQSLDFRIGGGEVSRLATPEGKIHALHSHYLDIVEGVRIIYAYQMDVGGRRISTSLATVEFTPAADGARMTFTEQVVFLDGLADATSRQQGTEAGFARLAEELAKDGAP